MGENVVLVYLVVCFFVFLAGFVDSIAGGGGLISLPAYMIAGLPVHTAIATNKMSSSMGTFVASFHYMKKGFMKWKICIPAVFGAIARILDRISSGSSDFGESFKDRHAGCASGHFVLCTEKQSTERKRRKCNRSNQWNADF